MFARMPNANVGLATAGLVVIDVDHGADPAFPEKLMQSGCPRQSTPSGGWHFIFRQPAGKAWRNTASRLAPNVDTRANGGYIVVAPSTFEGKPYRWENELPLFEDLPEPPQWLADDLDAVSAPVDEKPILPTMQTNAPAVGMVETITRAAAYVAAMPAAIAGSGGHGATYAAATSLVHGFGLSEEMALSLLSEQFNQRCEPPWSEAELRHKVHDSAEKPHRHDKGWLLVDSVGQVGDDFDDVDISAIIDKLVNMGRPKRIERDWQSFPIDVLPEPVRRFVAEASLAMHVDSSYISLPAIIVAAAAIGNRLRVQVKPGWTEPPILWGAIVGKSGTTKSPPLAAAVKPLDDVQDEEFNRVAAEIAGAGKPEDVPAAKRFVTNNVTLEALLDRLQDAPHGILAYSDELSGWMRGFDQYKKAGGGGDLSYWLQLHGGRRIIVDRKTGVSKVICIPRASACVLGAIQPDILRRSFDQEAVSIGLASRFLLANPPEHKRQWCDDELSPKTEAKWAEVVNKLLTLRAIESEDGQGNLSDPVVKLTEQAQAAFKAFVNRRGVELLEIDNEALRTVYPKLEGGAGRLAMVVHCMKWASGLVPNDQLYRLDHESMEAGIELSDWFLNEAARFCDGAQHSKQDDLRIWIEDQGGEATVRKLTTNRHSIYPTAELAKKALNELAASGLGTWEKRIGPKGGRPSHCFVLQA